MMKVTKESLLKENSKLQQKINLLETQDSLLRKEFVNVMFPSSPNAFPYSYTHSSKDTCSWKEIFFRLGELNSDANYTILLEQKFNLENKVRELEEALKKRGNYAN